MKQSLKVLSSYTRNQLSNNLTNQTAISAIK